VHFSRHERSAKAQRHKIKYVLEAAFYHFNDGKNAKAQMPTDMQTMPVIFIIIIVDPQANVAPGIPEAAICVQVIAAQYILQFAIVIALCCALHRFASRVIHRSE